MKVSNRLQCAALTCADIDKDNFILPSADIDAEKIKLLIIAEAPPENKTDYFYAPGNPLYLQTVIHVFKDAGVKANSLQDILNLGVYITTAIKCPKKHYAISLETMQNCTRLLEQEIAFFPNLKVFLLGGEVAIKMMNDIWKKQAGKKVIPPGSTYKIRKQAFYFKDKRVLPSYTPAGKNFLIETSKRKMVAEDIKAALSWIK
jgi:uracil-DNA glycosylase